MKARFLSVSEEEVTNRKEGRLESTLWFWIGIRDTSISSWFTHTYRAVGERVS